MTSNEREKLKQEMSEIQEELNSALNDILNEMGKKLKPHEQAEIKKEFSEIVDLLDRIKTGLVWVAIFGKTSSGKSAIANALLEADVAPVGIEHDLTNQVSTYQKEPWMLVDMPGTMGKSAFEQMALAEAKKAHAHIFVIDQEPYEDEIELFDAVTQLLPETPKIVFCNKADRFQHIPPRDVDKVKSRVREKMRKYVKDEKDIIFGNAQIYNPQTQGMERQPLTGLLEHMYNNVGDLGMIMNVLDPANRAQSTVETVRKKVLEIRIKIARKAISAFAVGAVATEAIPMSSLFTMPGVLGSMTFVIAKVMGVPLNKEKASKLAVELLKSVGIVLAGDFLLITALYIGASTLTAISGGLAAASVIAALGTAGYIRYKRTVIFGEIVIYYIRHDFSWGGEEPKKVIKRCKEQAEQLYLTYKKEE